MIKGFFAIFYAKKSVLKATSNDIWLIDDAKSMVGPLKRQGQGHAVGKSIAPSSGDGKAVVLPPHD